MTVRILRGDCRDVLKTLPDESVHCVVTSPPYWGLRDYGLPPSVWGGDASCEHEFGEAGSRHRGGPPGDGDALRGRDQSARAATADVATGQTCMKCGAWRGCLGLEPTPQMFVEHLVEVFREVRRVLRADGTLWLNLGDSYATGAGKVGDAPGGGEQGARWKGETTRHRDEKRRPHGQPVENGRGEPQAERTRSLRDGSHAGKHTAIAAMGPMIQPNRMPIPGLKPKDLVMVPARAALALQADGWWVRQDIIWRKPNPMPESVRDRCTKAHEYIFLLSKSERYYFDAEAILEPVSANTHARLSQDVQSQVGSERAHAGGKTNGNMKAVGRRPKAWDVDMGSNRTLVAGQQRKMSSYRPSGWAPSDKGEMRGRYPRVKNNESFDAAMAIMPSKRNKRSVWTVTTQPFKEAHFATFPPALIEPCILAGAPRGGVVLDPFGGAGTTGLVADRHGRDAVLIELNPDYADMAERRITGDSPLFSEVAA